MAGNITTQPKQGRWATAMSSISMLLCKCMQATTIISDIKNAKPKSSLNLLKSYAYTMVSIHFGLVGELYCSSVDDTTDPPPKFATSLYS